MKNKNGLYKVFTWRKSGKKTLGEFRAYLELKDWTIVHEIKENPKNSFFGLIKKSDTITLVCRYGV